MPRGWTLVLSAFASPVALAPVFRRTLASSWWSAVAVAGGAGAVAVAVVWLLQAWIPPVPLQLTRGTFAQAVDRLEPVDPVSRLPVDELRRWGSLTAFSAVAAPAGLRQPIVHVWRKDGVVVGRVVLSALRGGRPGGFRTYSRKTDLGDDPAGQWSVDVLTAAGQLIGRIRLTVTPDAG